MPTCGRLKSSSVNPTARKHATAWRLFIAIDNDGANSAAVLFLPSGQPCFRDSGSLAMNQAGCLLVVVANQYGDPVVHIDRRRRIANREFDAERFVIFVLGILHQRYQDSCVALPGAELDR